MCDYSFLDAEYELALEKENTLRMIRNDRMSTPWSGCYLVIVDLENTACPVWSPEPKTK
jgi:hypothetical protein